MFTGGSVTLVAAPKLEPPAPIPTGQPPSLDPGFGRTNDADRFLASGSYEVAGVTLPGMPFSLSPVPWP